MPRRRPLCLASLCHTCGRGREMWSRLLVVELASTEYTRSRNELDGRLRCERDCLQRRRDRVFDFFLRQFLVVSVVFNVLLPANGVRGLGVVA